MEEPKLSDSNAQSPPPPKNSQDPMPGAAFFEKMGVAFSPHPQVAQVGAGEMPKEEEKLWALFCHVGAIIGLSFVAPLVIYIVCKERSPFVASHARESLNFQISYIIFAIACMFLMWLVIPFFLFAALSVLMLVAGIIGGIKAYEGGFMAMPLAIRFIK